MAGVGFTTIAMHFRPAIPIITPLFDKASHRKPYSHFPIQNRAGSSKPPVSGRLAGITDVVDVRVGSFASFCGPAGNFGSATINGHLRSRLKCLKGARFGGR
jgi:hypothetical protein